MTYAKVKEYNTYLVNNKLDPTILDYVKKINTFDNNNGIDIKFIDEFIELVGNDTFCIHHSMLQTYGVLTTIKTTKDVKRLLDQYKFKEGIDYLVGDVAHQVISGTKYKNEYLLKSRTFKLCLMRAKNIKSYAYYYLLLEECIAYHKEFKHEWNERYITELKEKVKIQKENYETQIEVLIKKLDEQSQLYKEDRNEQRKYHNEQRKKHKEQMEKSDEILKNNIDIKKELKISHEKIDNITEELVETKEVLVDIKEELIETKEELEDTNNNVKLIAEKLDIAVTDRVSRPKNLLTLEYFIVMKSNTNTEYKYYIIRGQKEHANRQKNKLNEYTEI